MLAGGSKSLFLLAEPTEGTLVGGCMALGAVFSGVFPNSNAEAFKFNGRGRNLTRALFSFIA